jgi:hypothetical protein
MTKTEAKQILKEETKINAAFVHSIKVSVKYCGADWTAANLGANRHKKALVKVLVQAITCK